MANQYSNSWKKEEIDYLIQNYGKIFGKDIAKRLGRTYCAIRHKAIRLKLYAPLSDFKNNNPAKNPIIKRKIRDYQKKRWKNKNSILNSKEYKEKQSKSLKKMWKNPKYLRKMKIRDKNCKNKGKIRTKEMKKNYSKIHKKMWKNPNSTYNSKKYQQELKKRIKEMIKFCYKNGSKPERQVKQIIKLNNLPFKFVGNGKMMIKRFCPDFICKSSKKIIEENGDYYHNLPIVKKRDKRKRKVYKKYGFKLLTIWEKELKNNPQKVTEKIINFYLK